MPERLQFAGRSPRGPNTAGRRANRPPGASRRQRASSAASRFDLRNTWQVVAGSILIPVGVAAILLAWYGAAHARVDQQQIPYMISGGLLGLGAIIAGALLYWAHWLYRIYDQADLQHQEMMRSQAEIRDAILGTASSAKRPASGTRSEIDLTNRQDVSNGSAFVATASGTNFHRPDCPIVARHPRGLRTVSEKAAHNLAPCRICEPLVHQD